MRTYKAILHGDRLEWLEEAPVVETPSRVDVVVLDEELPAASHARGLEMAAILERLARRRAFSDMTDPVGWQRDLRQDRPLPGRDA